MPYTRRREAIINTRVRVVRSAELVASGVNPMAACANGKTATQTHRRALEGDWEWLRLPCECLCSTVT